MSRLYRFDRRNPVPRAVCDQCGFIVRHSDLRMQKDYRGGDAPVPIGILVCPKCYDEPQPQLARPLIKRDPYPQENPRPIPPIIEMPVWILADGFWNDNGIWIDGAQWIDSL